MGGHRHNVKIVGDAVVELVESGVIRAPRQAFEISAIGTALVAAGHRDTCRRRRNVAAWAVRADRHAYRWQGHARDGFPIEKQLSVAKLNRVPRRADHTLDE